MPPTTPDCLTTMRSLLLELTRAFLGDYLRLIEPDTAVHLLPDQATFPTVDTSAWAADECCELGLVAQIPARDGTSLTLLVQIEPEPRGPAQTADRFGRWFLALETRLVQPVLLSVLYLRGGRPGANLESCAVGTVYSLEVVRIFYTAFGLSHARADFFLNRPEPLAWALAAAMQPVRYSRDELCQLALGKIRAANDLDSERRDLLQAFVETASRSM